MTQRRSFRLEKNQASLGPETHMYGLPTGYKLLYVLPDAVEGIEAGDDVIHDGNVYPVFEKKEFDGPNMAVELTVSYEGSGKSPSSVDDPDWPEIVGE